MYQDNIAQVQDNSLHREHFYTQKLLHTDAFTHKSFYTQKLLHTEALHTKFSHTEAFTYRHFHTQTVLHTETFTHRRSWTTQFGHSESISAHRLIYAHTHTLLLRNILSNYWCGTYRTCKKHSSKPDRRKLEDPTWNSVWSMLSTWLLKGRFWSSFVIRENS